MEKRELFLDSDLLNNVSKNRIRMVKIRIVVLCASVIISFVSFVFASTLPILNRTTRLKVSTTSPVQTAQNMTTYLKEEAIRIVDSLIPYNPPTMKATIVTEKPEPKTAEPARVIEKRVAVKSQQNSISSKPSVPKSSIASKTATTAKPKIGGDSAPTKPQKDLHSMDENLPVEKRLPIPQDSNYGIPEYWPLPFKVSDPYGYLPWRGRFHSGIDITTNNGELIFSAGSGKVIRCEWFAGYGMCIDIEHASGYITRYGHLSGYLVKLGDMVEEGTWIGKVGSTGNSSCNHLHFEVHLNGHTINPESLRWLNKVQ